MSFHRVSGGHARSERSFSSCVEVVHGLVELCCSLGSMLTRVLSISMLSVILCVYRGHCRRRWGRLPCATFGPGVQLFHCDLCGTQFLQCLSFGGHRGWPDCAGFFGRSWFGCRRGWSGGQGTCEGRGLVCVRSSSRASASMAVRICVRYPAGWKGLFLCFVAFRSALLLSFCTKSKYAFFLQQSIGCEFFVFAHWDSWSWCIFSRGSSRECTHSALNFFNFFGGTAWVGSSVFCSLFVIVLCVHSSIAPIFCSTAFIWLVMYVVLSCRRLSLCLRWSCSLFAGLSWGIVSNLAYRCSRLWSFCILMSGIPNSLSSAGVIFWWVYFVCGAKIFTIDCSMACWSLS